MSEYGRVLAVDVGAKRVGLARTDLLRINANPVGTYSPPESFKEIERQIANEGPVIAIVVGWPLDSRGEPTDATHLAKEYIHTLEKKHGDIPVFKLDERYSSREARKILVESGVPLKKREEKGRVDQAAAALILQQFLESRPEL